MEHDDDNFEFDDPGLKGAVQRAWGGESAPHRLRGRISHLIATAGSIDYAAAKVGPPTAWQRWTSRAYAAAAAAIVVFAIALLALYYQGALDSLRPRQARQAAVVPTRTSIPTQLVQSLVTTHATGANQPEHHFADRTLGAKSYAELSLKLTADLGFPVLARRIGEDWKFLGAGEFTAGDLRGSQLMFARGDDTISIFALPSHCMSGCASGAQFDGIVDSHPVAGFARSGAAYAVVGSSPTGSLSPKAVAAIRDGLFAAFEPAACGDGSGGLDPLE